MKEVLNNREIYAPEVAKVNEATPLPETASPSLQHEIPPQHTPLVVAIDPISQPRPKKKKAGRRHIGNTTRFYKYLHVVLDENGMVRPPCRHFMQATYYAH
jgi:hypothetical protein